MIGETREAGKVPKAQWLHFLNQKKRILTAYILKSSDARNLIPLSSRAGSNRILWTRQLPPGNIWNRKNMNNTSSGTGCQ
jgi:hypothetical protein